MNNNVLKMLMSMCVVFAATSAWAENIVSETDSLTMRREADEFLARMPEGLQQRQCEAVLAAIDDDYDALDDVRASRNVAPAISPGVKVKDMKIQRVAGLDIEMRLFSPEVVTDSARLPLLVYFHGGGWTFGSINSCARFCDAVAATGKAAVLAVDYSLAPDSPYPDGLLDCVAALDYALDHSHEWGSSPELVSVGGDSSGGNLAIASSMCRAAGESAPLRSIVLFYPVVRAENDGSESWCAYGSGYGLDADLMEAFNKAYALRAENTAMKLISPAVASDSDLRSLPPILMVSAERDILTSQGREFADRLTGLGHDICRVELPGTVHLFITVAGQEHAFRRSVDMAADFLSVE